MHDFQFGDIIENGWASKDNPTKRGVFLRYLHRTGKLNPGKHAVLRFESGVTGEFRIDMEARLTKIGTIFDADRIEIARLRLALKPFAEMADAWSESEPDTTLMDFHEPDGAHINLGHCRAARAAIDGDRG